MFYLRYVYIDSRYGSVMGQQISSHKTPHDKFDELGTLYPTGQYGNSDCNTCFWFEMYVMTDMGSIKFVWFKDMVKE